MKVKCPYCEREVEVDFDSDLDTSMWNFDGKTALVEIDLYCEDCERGFEVDIEYTLTPIPNEIKIYKK